jgi:hypothetical protein
MLFGMGVTSGTGVAKDWVKMRVSAATHGIRGPQERCCESWIRGTISGADDKSRNFLRSQRRTFWLETILTIALSFAGSACRIEKMTPSQPQPRPEPQHKLADQPKGFRFKDGWLLEWETSAKLLTTHYPKQVKDNSVVCFDSTRAGTLLPDQNYCLVRLDFDLVPELFIHREPNPNDSGQDRGTIRLLYFHDRFYEANSPVPVENFDRLESSLVAVLGEPESRQASTVENRMGAKFDQLEAVWLAGNVVARLEKRGAHVDSGSFSLTYTPIANEVPAEPTSKAPF